jgi:mersacidin/lichenicidin family type 2 lantibiotic
MLNVIHECKQEEHRLNRPETDRAGLPANLAGLVEITNEDQDQVIGGLGFGRTGLNPQPLPPA